MKLSVIMPSYKEAGQIRNNLRITESTLKKLGIKYEIILVDDGSKENIYRRVVGFSRNVKPYRYEVNQGKGYAIKFGFSKSTGDVVTFLDADLDIPPGQIRILLSYMKKRGADIVIGSKSHPLSHVQYPLKRKILSASYGYINRMLFGLPVRDTQVGVKLFRREVLEEVLPRIVITKYAFDLELLVIACKMKYSVVESPVEINYRDNGSGVSAGSIRNMFMDTMAIAYRLHVAKHYDRAFAGEGSAS